MKQWLMIWDAQDIHHHQLIVSVSIRSKCHYIKHRALVKDFCGSLPRKVSAGQTGEVTTLARMSSRESSRLGQYLAPQIDCWITCTAVLKEWLKSYALLYLAYLLTIPRFQCYIGNLLYIMYNDSSRALGLHDQVWQSQLYSFQLSAPAFQLKK